MRYKSPYQQITQKLLTVVLMSVISVANILPAQAASRIKDLVSIEGVRSNQLVGYGLVVGLNGTGDSLRNAPTPNKVSLPCWNGLGSIPEGHP